MQDPDTDGWPKWSAWVVEGLKETKQAIEHFRLETKADIAALREDFKREIASLREADIAAIREDVNRCKVDVAMLQVKAGLWGAAGASIPIIIMLAMEYLR